MLFVTHILVLSDPNSLFICFYVPQFIIVRIHVQLIQIRIKSFQMLLVVIVLVMVQSHEHVFPSFRICLILCIHTPELWIRSFKTDADIFSDEKAWNQNESQFNKALFQTYIFSTKPRFFSRGAK